nr:protein ALP1-like [Tanacetum cinerariifolium]
MKMKLIASLLFLRRLVKRFMKRQSKKKQRTLVEKDRYGAHDRLVAAYFSEHPRGDHGPDPFILLEAIAFNYLWIWHAFFGVFGMNNDVNVLRQSSLFNDLKSGKAPDVPFVANNVPYKGGYYLIDVIYPQWSVLIKSIKNPDTNDHKRILYKKKHEAAIKNMWNDVKEEAKAN